MDVDGRGRSRGSRVLVRYGNEHPRRHLLAADIVARVPQPTGRRNARVALGSLSGRPEERAAGGRERGGGAARMYPTWCGVEGHAPTSDVTMNARDTLCWTCIVARVPQPTGRRNARVALGSSRGNARCKLISCGQAPPLVSSFYMLDRCRRVFKCSKHVVPCPTVDSLHVESIFLVHGTLTKFAG